MVLYTQTCSTLNHFGEIFMRADRLDTMEQYIIEKENVSLETLAKEFNVSLNTIRRDIAELLRRGNIRKVYGGVSSNLLNHPLGFSVREQKNSKAKQIIGELAASLVEDDSSIFVDSGSTTPNLLRHLGNKQHVTVVTHSLTAMYEASLLPNLDIIALGGAYGHEASSFTGISTLEPLSHLSIQTIFMAATGVTLEHGLTHNSYLETEIKRSAVQRGNRVVLMADQSKFGRTAVINFLPFEDLYAVVTDRMPPANYVSFMKEHGIRLICPGHES